MNAITVFRQALWSIVGSLEGKKDIPMRHVSILLFILEKGETSAPDIQAAFETAQAVVSRIIIDLKGYGLVETYQGVGENSKRNMVAPSTKGKALAKALTKSLGRITQ